MFVVWAREVNSTADYQAYNYCFYTVNAYSLNQVGIANTSSNQVSTVSIGVSPSSPQVVGTPVTINAFALGSTDPRYKFWVYKDGQGTVMQEYSAQNTCDYTPVEVGEYMFVVWARDVDSLVDYQACCLNYFMVGIAQSLPNLIVNPDQPKPDEARNIS